MTRMAKPAKNHFFCSACGHENARWFGRCPACGAWSTATEAPAAPARGAQPDLLLALLTRDVQHLATARGERTRELQ